MRDAKKKILFSFFGVCGGGGYFLEETYRVAIFLAAWKVEHGRG